MAKKEVLYQTKLESRLEFSKCANVSFYPIGGFVGIELEGCLLCANGRYALDLVVNLNVPIGAENAFDYEVFFKIDSKDAAKAEEIRDSADGKYKFLLYKPDAETKKEIDSAIRKFMADNFATVIKKTVDACVD